MSNAIEASERLLEPSKASRFSVNGSCKLDANHAALLDNYLAIIKKWDRVHSLVSKGDLNHLEERHVTDSLVLEPFLNPATRHLDIGSGAGFPGVPLAICRPDVHVVLNDRSTKKCRFLREVSFRLKLKNVTIFESDISPRKLSEERFDTISIRAVAPPDIAWTLARPLLGDQGLVLLHTSNQFASDVSVFEQGVVHSCIPSVRGWITVVAQS